MLRISRKIILATIAITTLFGALTNTKPTYAKAGQFSISPMHQLITLTPGETYTGNFTIINPAENTTDFYYTIDIEPFTTYDNDEFSFTANGDFNQIVDWISLSTTEGIISPNQTQEIRFFINVPENVAAGGQYAAIRVASSEYSVDNTTVDLREVYRISHLIYADVAGETIRKGSINDINVPSFLLTGNIVGSSNIKNEGNVHSQAIQTLQIFPLLSNEEIFTNEEEPKITWIMPGATNLSSVSWDNTPLIGIFHVIYKVEFEGVESKVDKIVIVCPLWLLFLILLAIFLIIFRILSVKKKSKK